MKINDQKIFTIYKYLEKHYDIPIIHVIFILS